MTKVEDLATVTGDQGLRDPEAEVIAFVKGRSVACPRCAYDLRDIQSATCPECGEPLVLKLGSTRARFGWLVLAMAPGCFSGVAAVFVLVPIVLTLWHRLPAGQGVPWPVMFGDAFGFMSAASVALMYRHRGRIMSWPTRRQGLFAGSVWGGHVLVFVLLVLALRYATQ